MPRPTVVVLLAVLFATGRMAVAGEPVSPPAKDEPAGPRRVVSMNLCTDELVLRLLPRDRIASVSYLSHDRRVSPTWREAALVPANHGRTEEVMRFDPDLVVAGEYTTRTTTDFLRRIGRAVDVVPLATSLAGVRRIIRDLAKRLQVPERGEALITAMDQRIAAVTPAANEGRPRALVLNPNGFTVGDGSLVSELIEKAGLENAAKTLAIDNYGSLPLERVILSGIDVLIVDSEREGPPSLATALLDHPALEKLGRRIVTVSVPSRLWTCAGPQVADAIDILAAAAEAARVPRS